MLKKDSEDEDYEHWFIANKEKHFKNELTC